MELKNYTIDKNLYLKEYGTLEKYFSLLSSIINGEIYQKYMKIENNIKLKQNSNEISSFFKILKTETKRLGVDTLSKVSEQLELLSKKEDYDQLNHELDLFKNIYNEFRFTCQMRNIKYSINPQLKEAVVDYIEELYKIIITYCEDIIDKRIISRIPILRGKLKDISHYFCEKEILFYINKYDSITKNYDITNKDNLSIDPKFYKIIKDLISFLGDLYDECSVLYVTFEKEAEKDELPKEEIHSIPTKHPISSTSINDYKKKINFSNEDILINSIRDEFIPPESFFLEVTNEDLSFVKYYNEYKNKKKFEIESLYHKSFEKNSKSLFLNCLLSLIDCFKKLGFVGLVGYYEQMMNNIKNVSSEVCFIMPTLFKTLFTSFESEADKIIDRIQMRKFSDQVKKVKEIKFNDDLIIDSPSSQRINMKETKKNDDIIYKSIIPIHFDSIFISKSNLRIESLEEYIDKALKDEGIEETSINASPVHKSSNCGSVGISLNKKTKVNNLDSFTDDYPFKQDKLNCRII